MDRIAEFKMTEVSLLEEKVKKATGVDSDFRKIKERLASIEAKVRHAYEKRITDLVLLLTIASLVTAIVSLLK